MDGILNNGYLLYHGTYNDISGRMAPGLAGSVGKDTSLSTRG
jgi:hypothetical protein